MGRPGNKRLQRALYGAAPSSATGTTTEGEGRYAVTRVTGSVINNGGNMRSGGYPRVGMGLAFLRKTRCNPNCDSFVGTDEDLVVVPTPLARANTQVTSLAIGAASTDADTKASTLSGARIATTTAVTARNNAVTLVNITSTQATLDTTRIAEATALVAYNVAVANHAASVAADAYITAASNTASALSIYNASPKAATDLATYDGVVASEATALAAWLVAEL